MEKGFKNYYFTFGSSKTFPFQNGWVIIRARDMIEAKKIFMLYFPNKSGYVEYLNCSFVYSEEEFKKTSMYKKNDNLGAGCHLTIAPFPGDRTDDFLF